MTQMTEAKLEEEVKHITKQLFNKTEKIKLIFTSSSRTKKKNQFLCIYDFTQIWNSTCSTAEAESSRSYSHKKFRWFVHKRITWVVQSIFRWFSQGRNKVQNNITLSYNAQSSCSNISLGSWTVDTSFWLLLILMHYWKSLKPWTKKRFEIFHGYKSNWKKNVAAHL